MHVLAVVGQVSAVAAVDPTAVDEQRLVAVLERRPRDRLLLEMQLGNAAGDPVEQLKTVSVAVDPPP